MPLAQLVPLDTVHTTHDRAMIVPPMGDVTPRDAGLHPTPAQTTTTRAAIVHPRGVAELQRHGDVRPVWEAVHTVRAGGQHHAIVMRNNEGGGEMSTPTHEPVRTLTSRGHQSLVLQNMHANAPGAAQRQPTPSVCTGSTLALVVPYDSTGEPRVASEQPTPTLTTRDRAGLLWTDDAIDDCLFRMFALHEIAGAMVMAEHVDGGAYIVTGNKRERMAQYGNAVTPPAARELVSRLLEVL